MTEKNPDAASKLACPEEEIPMGMTPWSQLEPSDVLRSWFSLRMSMPSLSQSST